MHWLMAACILAMLFIGVGMVADLSDARFDPQTARHRHSGGLIRPHDRLAAARVGNAVGSRVPRRLIQRLASSRDPAAERQPAYPALGRTFLSCLRVLCADPAARRG